MRIPARMADLVAAALVGDPGARLRILEELEVGTRIGLVVREVAGVLLRVQAKGGAPSPSA